MSSYEAIRSVTVDEDCKLELMKCVDVTYGGFKPATTYELTYLSPTGETNSYYTNNTEIFGEHELELAMEKFDERLASEPYKATAFSKSRRLDSFLERA